MLCTETFLLSSRNFFISFKTSRILISRSSVSTFFFAFFSCFELSVTKERSMSNQSDINFVDGGYLESSFENSHNEASFLFLGSKTSYLEVVT